MISLKVHWVKWSSKVKIMFSIMADIASVFKACRANMELTIESKWPQLNKLPIIYKMLIVRYKWIVLLLVLLLAYY